jgi:NAD(P)-dependent dehydrogenase (short-subunit alcohol dehydrogenase family)
MSKPLQGRHAIVTGGGRGIGAAIARALAAQGARVTLMGRTAAPLAALARELPGGQAIPCDVTDEAGVAGAFMAAGACDILVNNAGAVESAPFERTDAALWERMLAVNLTGAFLCARQALPAMRAQKWGRIINIASTAAHKGYAYVAAYCAAKHGLLGLTRALALEVARDGVTVNAVSPGFTETDLLAGSVAKIAGTTGRSEEQARAQLLRDMPHGRFVTPEEVAAAAVWFCLPEAAGVTGQARVVDGSPAPQPLISAHP